MRPSRVSGGGATGVVVVYGAVAEHELELARVLAPGGEQAVAGEVRGRVLGAPDHGRMAAHALPQRGRRVQEEQVDVARGGQRAQDVEVARRGAA